MISPLDEDFPLGDGTADLAANVVCPYCAEESSIAIDPGSGASQEYVEDCPVCCQPWRVTVRYGGDGIAAVSVAALDD
jgi:cysteine-rich CPXCG protein